MNILQRPPALPLAARETTNCNASMYTLDTVDYHDEESDRAPLLSPTTPDYGATFPRSPGVPQSSTRVIFNATLKMACIFIVSSILLGGTLYLALPTLEESVTMFLDAILCAYLQSGRTDLC